MRSMLTELPPIPFSDRRARLAERIGDGALVLPAARERVRSRDTMHGYSPDRDLYYLTGLAEPDACAVFVGDGNGGMRFELFVRDRDPLAELWNGPREGPEATGERLGADAAHSITALGPTLDNLLSGVSRIFFQLDTHPSVEPHVLRALNRFRAMGNRGKGGPVELVEPGVLLNPMRLRKGPTELARMREAARITVAAFDEVVSHAHPGMGEWEIEGRLNGAFRAGGGGGPAYGTIVGSGSNATVLHYIQNQDVIDPGRLVLVDAGADFDFYAADITRTFPIDGVFDDAQREIYEIVNRARAAAIEVIRPGASLASVHEAALAVLRGGLEALGLLQIDDEPDAIKAWYPHRTSHWLGLDVHDVGDYARDGESILLEAGMVLTVEPGLYFGPAAMEQGGAGAERFEGIGVRIEDDIVVTPEGHENLTSGAPTDPDDVASWVGSRLG